jgi:hypothetical protein
MSQADRPPHQLLDRMIRQSLRHPDNLRALLGQAIPDLAGNFDCTRARLLEREFPLDDWRHREADVPLEVPFRLGTGEFWALVVLLVEHQSQEDPVMPLRLLYFAVTYWDRQWRDWEKTPRPRPSFRLNPVLPLVLYTADTPLLTWALWRRPAGERANLLAVAQNSQENLDHRQEVKTVGQTIAEALIAEGEALGVLRTSRRILHRVLAQRFGALPPTILQRIEAAEDPEGLQACIERVSALKSLDDLPL